MRSTPPPPPLALIVFLENLGHITGVNWPAWVGVIADFVAEEYSKCVLRLHGIYRRYDKVVILEDARATGPDLRAALVGLSRTHRVDLMILSHGLPDTIVGYKGLRIPASSFGPLLNEYQQNPRLLNLRSVWQMNCYGATLAQMWRDLGARSVNGSVGINWLPEPTLSLFTRRWLRGDSFADAVHKSATRAECIWSRIYRTDKDARLHPRLGSSRPIVLGEDTTFDA